MLAGATHAGRSGRGFTLVELLVVVAIVALLTAILLPALAAARRSGQRVVCLSNIRQLAVGNALYASDHDRLVPMSQFAAEILNTSGGLGVNVRWCWSDDTPGDPRTAFRNGLLAPYLQGALDIAGCPTFETPDDIVRFYTKVGLAYPLAVDYGYNGLLLGDRHSNFYASDPATVGYRSWLGYRPSEITRPATTAMFADSAQLFPTGPAPSPKILPPIAVDHANGGPRALPLASVHGRHDGRAAVAWVDGHATAERVRIYADQPERERAERLGYVAPELADGHRSNEWMFVK